MNFSRTVLNAAVAAGLTAASGLAFATDPAADGNWACANVTFSTAAADCYGAIKPPPNDSVDSINSIISGEGWAIAPVTDGAKDENSGVGSDVSIIDGVGTSSSGAGYVTFASAISDPFVLVLKLGQGWSAFLFNGIAAGNLTFDLNQPGVTTGLGLSHATLYGSVTAVPEPSTYALMFAGLGVVGFMARRRKQQA